MLEIKKLPTERWKEFKALRLEALKNDPLAFGSSYEEEKKFSDDIWKKRLQNTLFALQDDILVGMIVYIFNKKNKLRHVAELFGVFARENFRNKKIGKKLVESALEIIRGNKNVVKVKLVVSSVQKPAIKLYESFGFEVVGQLKNELKVDDKFYDGLIMEKYLN